MRRLTAILLLFAGAVIALSAVNLPKTQAANPFRRSRNSVENLAEKLDYLERQLQFHGRVTAKAPDIWGQARLTAHRQEFEDQMSAQLNEFKNTLQAEISISDQAFLSEAMSLAAASRAVPNAPPVETGPQLNVTNLTGLLPAATVGSASATVPADSATTSNVIVRTAPLQALSFVTPSNINVDAKAFSLEPEILLDQRKRYLDHLHEIRRINEGDDTVDAPGYALNLVRIPVSVIPGNKTRENYGAEVTVTVESHVTEELLETTFRELVVNDLVDLLALPVVKYAEMCWIDLKKVEATTDLVSSINENIFNNVAMAVTEVRENPQVIPPLPSAADSSAGGGAADKPAETLESLQVGLAKDIFKRQMLRSLPPDRVNQISADIFNEAKTLDEVQQNAAMTISALPADEAPVGGQPTTVQLTEDIAKQLGHPITPALTARDRRSRYPIPPSQFREVIGRDELAKIVVAAFSARDRHLCRDALPYTDVQAFLRNELQAAYDFLNSADCSVLLPSGEVIMTSAWGPDTMPSVSQIRRPKDLQAVRERFYSSQHKGSLKAGSATEALAWAILVESSLLNQKLNEDMQHVSQDPNCNCMPIGQQFIFFGNHPDAVAKRAFAEYVKCRWPIRVFALDPVTQQQNVADTFSLRREMQVALALSFQQRFVNAQSLTRYMRRVEQDIRTISLNNTVVGFGSGDDTFGWRFFPRVQTPDVEGTFTVIGRDLICGGPNRDAKMKNWRIEPGMRECVALVVMPSFIRHVRFDVRTDWFPLVPHHVLSKTFRRGLTPPSMEKTVEWSKLIKSMEDSVACCIQDEHLYRNGEVERLLKRSHQLSQELPLNTMHAQVPYENVLGGFEMFSSGVKDLAPELIGYYGAPGINPDGDTQLFLVGKNFSMKGAKVIAGNANVKFSLISRQVMQATIPKEAQREMRLCEPRQGAAGTCAPCDCNDAYVEVRLATPYGASSPLLVPLKPNPKCGDAAVTPKPPEPQVKLQLPSDLQGDGKFKMRYLCKLDASGKVTEIADGDIRIPSPHRLELVLPDTLRLPVGDSKLEIRLISISLKKDDAAAKEVAFEPFQYAPAGMPLLTTGLLIRKNDKYVANGYAIDDANFKSLHLNLKNAIANYLLENPSLAPGDKDTLITVKLAATIFSDTQTRTVTNEDLPLTIRATKKL